MGEIRETGWVRTLVKPLGAALKKMCSATTTVSICDGYELAYANEVLRYGWQKDEPQCCTSTYQTDLLICDEAADQSSWVPRVVIECKRGAVTTHDALTYSTKAATHKHVHPYLRYGFLAGEREHYAIPVRLVKHGAHFDFMATWRAARPTKAEWSDFCALVVEEIKASRAMQDLLRTHRSAKRKKVSHPASSARVEMTNCAFTVRG